MDENNQDNQTRLTLNASKTDWTKIAINTAHWSAGPIGIHIPRRAFFSIPHTFMNALSESMNSKEADMWLSTSSGVTVAGPLLWDEAIAKGIELTSESLDTLLMHNGAGVLMALFHGGKAFIQVTLGDSE